MLRRLLATAWVLCFLATPLVGQVNITDGTSSYSWDPANFQATDLIDQDTGDVSFEDMWIVRFQDSSGLGSTTRVLALNNAADADGVFFTGTTNTGDSAVSTWNINGQAGGPVMASKSEDKSSAPA